METKDIESEHVSREEASLQRLFDATTAPPSDECLGRMLARATEIPEASQTAPGRWSRRVKRLLWLPLTLSAVAAAMLAVGVWLADSTNEPIAADVTPWSTPIDAVRIALGMDGSEHASEDGDRAPVVTVALADPLAGLDPDWDADEESFALLDPPHMAFSDVDDKVWVEVYAALLKDTKSF